MSLNDPLQQLHDRQAIADLITRLGLMLDERRYDEAPTILANDVIVQTRGGSARGLDAAVEQARRNHTVRTQHAITGVLIDLEGDRAEARANLIVTFAPDAAQPESRLMIGDAEQPGSHLMVGARYRFEGVRGDHGWRLRTIEMERVWSTQPIPAGALVTETRRGATAAAE
jgi:hypothetical protein